MPNHSYLPIEKVNREEHHETLFNYLKETQPFQKMTPIIFIHIHQENFILGT
jgi:hypothetical protein